MALQVAVIIVAVSVLRQYCWRKLFRSCGAYCDRVNTSSGAQVEDLCHNTVLQGQKKSVQNLQFFV